MTDESPAPRPSGAGDAKLFFHIAAGGFIPGLGLVLSGAFAIVCLTQKIAHSEHRQWTRRLIALVGADLLVALAATGLYLSGALEQAAVPADKPVIGAAFDVDGEESRRVISVLKGSPADEAELLANDVVDAVDGEPADSFETLRGRIEKTEPGTGLMFSVTRGTEQLEIRITPRLRSKLRPPPGGLFEIQESAPLPRETERTAVAGGLIALSILAIWFYARRKPGKAVPVWRGFILALVGTFGGVTGLQYLLRDALGGWSTGLMLLTLMCMPVIMLLFSGLASLWLPLSPGKPLSGMPLMAPWKTVLLGALYFIGGVPRIGFVLLAIDHFVLGGQGKADKLVETIAAQPLGTLGTAMLFTTVALLVPVAEEILFRGYLLPRLGARLGGGAAIVASSAIFGLLHYHYALFVLISFYQGLVLGWMRVRSGGVGAPILLHAANNGIALTVALLVG